MGQYYKFMNIDKKQVCERNIYLLKLMEHSYLGNDYCSDILKLLDNEWKGDRVIHVGDYAESNDETTTQNIIKNLHNELKISNKNTLYNYSDSFEDVIPTSKEDIRYVYNLDKREYVDLYKQPIQWCYCDEKSFGTVKINSFALLIGCGNGLGSGDYHGINERFVGYWAGDKFVSSSTPIEEYNNFTLRNEIYNEKKEYTGLDTYDEKIILGHEEKLYKNEIENFQKCGRNLKKVKFSSFGLLEEEKKNLKILFNKYKEKGQVIEL